LGIEARVYLDCKGVCGFAELYDRFQTSDGSRVLVIQRLGTDLNRIRLSLPNQSLTQADALKLCLETFARIWSLHDRNWMHRDIKPSNFVVGLPQSEMDDQVFIIDFGLARQRQEKSRPTGACPILGTDAYRPISNYSRVEYQPKDDIESWFYMCHEFFNGKFFEIYQFCKPIYFTILQVLCLGTNFLTALLSTSRSTAANWDVICCCLICLTRLTRS